MLAQPGNALRTLRRLEVLVIGLVEHHHYVARHRGKKRLDLGRGQPGAGRVVRIGDENDAGARRDRRPHGIEVVAVGARSNLDSGRPTRLNRQRINGKGVLGVNGVIARTEEGLRRQLEHVVGTVAEHYLLARGTQPRRERSLEREAVAIRIARDVGGGGGDRRPHPRTGPARIFVRGELDDRGLGNPVFARQLIDRLARDIRRDAAHIFGCLGDHACARLRAGGVARREWVRFHATAAG